MKLCIVLSLLFVACAPLPDNTPTTETEWCGLTADGRQECFKTELECRPNRAECTEEGFYYFVDSTGSKVYFGGKKGAAKCLDAKWMDQGSPAELPPACERFTL